MKYPILAGLASALMLGGCGSSVEMPEPAYEDISAAQSAASMLQERLQARLMSAMQEGGIEEAITACSEDALVISAEVSAETGLEVGRTSLRVRNPANAPDAWETEQFGVFEEARASGVNQMAMQYSEVVDEEGSHVFRWMKPIFLGDFCATCHGTDISPEVQAAIDAIYADDQATGFEVGDIRGAFTVRLPL